MFKKTKNSLAITLSAAMMATMITVPGVASAATATPTKTTKLEGQDRYDTALKIVEAGWEKSDSAVIARGDDLADALAAAPLAYAKGKSPILLTKTNEIPDGVLQELKDLGVKNLYIVGGVGAVTQKVEDKLAATGVTITRVQGVDRYATSLAIANAAFGATPADVVIANGVSYVDALSVSSIAANKGMPILLVNNNKLSAEQAAYIAGKTVYAIGGEGVLNTDVVSVAKATRVSGLDRYKTNAAVLAQFKPDYSKIYIAKGTQANYVDALAGSALAALTNSPIVLVNQANELNAEQETVVAANIADDSELFTLGGTVTQAAADAVEALKTAVTGAVKVESVNATKVNTLEVTFNKAVDTTDVTLAVTKGASAVEGTVVWNADKTVATITTTAKMTNGIYTVTAKSAADSTTSIGTTEVKSQYVKEIKILNDVALTGAKTDSTTDAAVAYVYYDVFDQYGESLKTSTNIEWSGSAGKITENRTTGKLSIERSDDKAFTYGEKLYITGVYTKTGVTASKTVSIGAKQALNSIEVAGFVKKGTSEILKTLPVGFKESAYYMVYNVKDQNGNAMDANKAVVGTDVTFVSDNVLLIKELTAESSLIINGNEYDAVLVAPGINVSKGGEVNITAIANRTGNKTEFKTAVGEDHILTSFMMSSPTAMIADGEDVVIPFEALDQNGEKMTDFVTLAKQTTFNKLSFTTSGGSLKLSQKADGTAELVYDDKDVAPKWSESQSTDGIDRTIALTSVVVGGDTSSQLLYIQDMARPEAISAVDMDNVLVEDGHTDVDLTKFTFLDQYGRKMDEADDTSDATEDATVGNGFFAASEKVSGLTGTDFKDYKFNVRATFKGNDGYLSDDTTPLAQNQEVKISTTEDLKLTATVATANNIVSSKSGFAVKYEIAKYKSGEDMQAISTAKTENVTIVDIKAVKGFAIDELNKFYVNTDKSDDATGDVGVGTNKLTVDNINTTLAAVDLVIPDTHEQEVEVTGYYNGDEVSIPAKYLDLDITDGKLAATTGTAITVDKVQDGKFKWSDFYDATTARYIRKDATDTLKIAVKDELSKVIDTISKSVTISDSKPVVAAIVADDAEKDLTLTIDPKNTTIVAPTSLLKTITVAGEKYFVEDQYGVDYTSATVTFKVASVVENAEGYAENNFTVSKNDTNEVIIDGAERGDTYVLTITATGTNGAKVTKDIKVTVGADENANITDSDNNYLENLIGDGTDSKAGLLEKQRIQGLN